MSLYTASIILLIALISSTHCNHPFAKIPGKKLKHITASINYIWGVTKADKIYVCPQPCTTGKWKHIPGHLRQIDAGDHEVWGVNRNNYIYKRRVDGGGGWSGVSGRAKDISASGNGYVFVVGTDSYLYHCKKPCYGSWTKETGKYTSNLKRVDAGYKYVYVLNKYNYVYYRAISGTKWYSAGTMSEISVGANYVYGIKNNKLYRCSMPCRYSFSWRLMKYSLCFKNEKMLDIEASVNSLVVIGSQHGVLRQPLTITESKPLETESNGEEEAGAAKENDDDMDEGNKTEDEDFKKEDDDNEESKSNEDNTD